MGARIIGVVLFAGLLFKASMQTKPNAMKADA
jgi:hypothetical protein